MDKDQIKVVEKFIKRLIEAIPDFTKLHTGYRDKDDFTGIYEEVRFHFFQIVGELHLYLDRVVIEGASQELFEELFEAFQQREKELDQEAEIKREKDLVSRLEKLVTKLDKGE